MNPPMCHKRPGGDRMDVVHVGVFCDEFHLSQDRRIAQNFAESNNKRIDLSFSVSIS
jgi:hypothetical protein